MAFLGGNTNELVILVELHGILNLQDHHHHHLILLAQLLTTEAEAVLRQLNIINVIVLLEVAESVNVTEIAHAQAQAHNTSRTFIYPIYIYIYKVQRVHLSNQ